MKVEIEFDNGEKISDIDIEENLEDIETKLNTGDDFILIGKRIYRTYDIKGVYKQE